MGKKQYMPIKRRPRDNQPNGKQRIFRFTEYGKAYLKLNDFPENEIISRIATYKGQLEEIIKQISEEYNLIKDIDYDFDEMPFKIPVNPRKRWNAKID